MNRRIFDSVVIDSIRTPEDKELVRVAMDNLGEGTLVKDCKTKQVKFSKSMIPIKEYNFKDVIKDYYDIFIKSPNKDNVIIDSLGNEHQVTLQVASIVKSLAMCRLSCPKVILDSVNSVLDAIDSKFTGMESNVETTIVFDEFGIESKVNKFTLQQVTKDIYGMLEKEGMVI